jgi:ABC-2 type transport system ATP-binding protein
MLPAGVSASELPAGLGSVRPLDDPSKVMIETGQVMPTLHALSGWAIDRGQEITDLQVHRPALEDIYLELTESPK